MRCDRVKEEGKQCSAIFHDHTLSPSTWASFAARPTNTRIQRGCIFLVFALILIAAVISPENRSGDLQALIYSYICKSLVSK